MNTRSVDYHEGDATQVFSCHAKKQLKLSVSVLFKSARCEKYPIEK